MRVRFDRGTLVLEQVPAELDPATLPGVLWDPRTGAFRAPASAWAELRAAVEQRWGTPDVSWRGTAAASGTGSWERVELRPYQAAALDAWTQNAGRGLVVLPTGSGKTRLGISAMVATGLPALCLVPTRVLMHQWVDAVRAVYGGPVARLGDGLREVSAITVATYESAWRRMDRIGDRFGLLVVDEAHHFGAGMRDEALEMAVAPARIGLTATPPEDEAALARLEQLVGPVVYRSSIQELAGRWLASYELVTLEVELTAAERRAYERDVAAFRAAHRPFKATFPGASWAEFARAAMRTDAGRRALAGWRRARKRLAYCEAKAGALRGLLSRHDDARVLVFTADNASAYAIAREHLVMPITCDIGKAERDDALERFRRGELRVLVSARVLNEGVDVPDADVAVIVGASLGTREHVQRIGRLLRPSEGKHAVIYELVVRDTTEQRRASRRREGLAPTRPNPNGARRAAGGSAPAR